MTTIQDNTPWLLPIGKATKLVGWMIYELHEGGFGPPSTPEFCKVLRTMVPRTLSIILCQHWCFCLLHCQGPGRI